MLGMFGNKKRLVSAAAAAVCAAVLWVAVVWTSAVPLFYGAILCSLAAVGWLAAALFRRRSPYAAFAMAVAAVTLPVSVWGVYDMCTDTAAFFPGLFGLIVLVGVLPSAAALLIVTLAVWLWRRRRGQGDTRQGDTRLS